ncbi:MAG: ZIP family metal transporter, partial [Bacillota bacterium]
TFFWRRPTDKSVSWLWGLAAGVMLAIVVIDLFPEAMNYGNLVDTIVGALGGILLLKYISNYFKCEFREGYIKTGILLGIGIALHNFPEGLAIGAGYAVTSQLGWGLALVMALHNFPEGLSMATPLNVGGVAPAKILFYTMLPGLPMGLGAFLGASVAAISSGALAITLGAAGGGMLYITLFELIPGAYNFNHGLQASLGLLIGVGLGSLFVIFV